MKVGMINGFNGVNSVRNNQARSFKGAAVINGAGGVITEGSSWVSASSLEPTIKGTVISALKTGLLAKVAACAAFVGAGLLAWKSLDDSMKASGLDDDTSIVDTLIMTESIFG